MSTALLVRHGQASWLSEDYDRLSALGERQARDLGALWARWGVALDRVFTGPRARQRGTATCVLEQLASAGLPVPALEELPDLDEYPADELVRGLAADLARDDPEVLSWVTAALGQGPLEERSRAVELLLRRSLSAWSRGAVVEGVETYEQFRGRARRVLDALVACGRGVRVAVFSSGGLLGAVVGEVLALDDARRLDLGTQLHNTGVAELRLGASRVSLARFDALDHLPGLEARTRR